MISVCLASYNGSLFIKEQVDSILLQLGPDDELIISDDNSKDDTISLVISINDSRIKILENAGDSLGVVKNFEKALAYAEGDYIFLCDQDDIWLPSKVELCVSYLQDNLLVVTDCSIVNERLQVIHPSFFKFRNSGKGVVKNIWKNTFLGCCIGFRRELLSLSLPMPRNIPMHDMWLGLLANIHGDVTFIDQPLSLYRRHQLAASSTGFNSDFGPLKKFWIRLVLSSHLLFRTLNLTFLRNH